MAVGACAALLLFVATMGLARVAEAQTPSADPVAHIRALLADTKYGEAEREARAHLSARQARQRDSLDEARALDLLAQVLVESGKAADPDAIASARRAVDLKQRLLGGNDPELAVSLSHLGLVLRRTGKLDEAGDCYARALRIREEALGPHHPDVGRTLAAQTALANNAGEFPRGRELGERAVAIAERAQPPDPVLTALAANNLAIALYELNDYSESQRRFEQALRSYEAALGPDHPEVAKTSTNLANVIGESGDLAEARTLYERALAIQERKQGRDHPDVALGLNNLADIHVRLGDYPQARSLFARALAILERTFGPEHTRVAMALGNLAEVHVRLGEHGTAEPLYERALRIREASLGPDHPSLVYTLTGLGDLRKHQRQVDEARALYERALGIAARAFGSDHPMVALALHGLGDILLEQGNTAEAEQRVGRALDMRRHLLGKDHPLAAESHALLAVILARTGRTDQAIEAALEAERVAREHLQVTAQALSERQAVGYAARRLSGVAIALSVLVTDPGSRVDVGTVRATWDAVTRSRAAVLEEVASRQRLARGADDRESGRLVASLVAARERLAGLLARSAADPASRSRVERAARDRDAAERALAEHSRRFRNEQQRGRAGIADVVAALPAHSALVAFVRFQRPGVAAHAYAAFVARSGGAPPVLIPLGDADPIERVVARWRSKVAGELDAGRPTRRGERVHRTVGGALRRLVWDPIETAVRDVKQVFVVPDGVLHLVNFGALPRRAGGYLVENGPLLQHLSAERDLIDDERQFGTGLLVVDDPDYDTASGGRTQHTSGAVTRAAYEPRRSPVDATPGTPCDGLRSLRFDPLPETGREADAIARLWTTAADQPAVLRLSGARATESAVKRSASGVRVLHLATHGFFAGAWCDEPAAASAPLVLAGLAFAGANARLATAPGGDDGILMAEEIATLDLHGVEWAVLSACDTGVGLPRAGEGLFGLRRMFQIAGARTVIVTLWPVVDRTTREWMTAAYRGRFVKGQSSAESLRQATLGLLNTLRARGEPTHPAYWAAFIAIGR